MSFSRADRQTLSLKELSAQPWTQQVQQRAATSLPSFDCDNPPSVFSFATQQKTTDLGALKRCNPEGANAWVMVPANLNTASSTSAMDLTTTQLDPEMLAQLLNELIPILEMVLQQLAQENASAAQTENSSESTFPPIIPASSGGLPTQVPNPSSSSVSTPQQEGTSPVTSPSSPEALGSVTLNGATYALDKDGIPAIPPQTQVSNPQAFYSGLIPVLQQTNPKIYNWLTAKNADGTAKIPENLQAKVMAGLVSDAGDSDGSGDSRGPDQPDALNVVNYLIDNVPNLKITENAAGPANAAGWFDDSKGQLNINTTNNFYYDTQTFFHEGSHALLGNLAKTNPQFAGLKNNTKLQELAAEGVSRFIVQGTPGNPNPNAGTTASSLAQFASSYNLPGANTTGNQGFLELLALNAAGIEISDYLPSITALASGLTGNSLVAVG